MPYAILTRMIRLICLTRIEVNSLLSFAEMTERDFESIFRRAAVVPIYARFFDATYLEANLKNHEKFGIFKRKPDLAQKFTTLPYAAGFNRICWVYEEKTSENGARTAINQYTRMAKYNGVTERFMSRSCRLPKPKEK